MTNLVALDLATTTGWARGTVGKGEPESGSVRLVSTGATHNALAAGAIRWLVEFTQNYKPDMIVIEAPVRKDRWRSSTEANDITTGLIFLARGVLYSRGIFDIRVAQVSAVRNFFIGGNPERKLAKIRTIGTCKALGWQPDDDNAADALALWAYQASLIDPLYGVKLSPLFNKRLAVS